ncbi:MAG: hypothetical protein LUG18_15500 [Candidatus Azobacteroides sp.]|nr:hypothetical protein [Candidatus Azobacteroides sp.]
MMKYLTATLSLFVCLFVHTCLFSQQHGFMMTVKGPVPIEKMGISLIHEHMLLAGFAEDDSLREIPSWDREKVKDKLLLYLEELKEPEVTTIVECTPAFIGRDPVLLRMLSEETGIQFITNTGYYGANNNGSLPAHALTETAEQLAERWIKEWENGIGNTGIRPGFIKTAVDGGHLSEVHQKLIRAAAKTHLASGLVIASHTGPAIPAFEQIRILQEEGVSPEAFIWVHAQAEKDPEIHAKAARMGAWVSLDGISEDNILEYVAMLTAMKERNLLHKVLISHDAGWYTAEEKDGGEIRGFTAIFDKLLPRLKENGFSGEDISRLLVLNPAKAFEVAIRKK